MHKKSFSILAENKAIFVREDSQIDFATGNFFNVFLELPSPACVPTWIDDQFKMCSLDDVDDPKNRVFAQVSWPIVYANGADQQSGMSNDLFG